MTVEKHGIKKAAYLQLFKCNLKLKNNFNILIS